MYKNPSLFLLSHSISANQNWNRRCYDNRNRSKNDSARPQNSSKIVQCCIFKHDILSEHPVWYCAHLELGIRACNLGAPRFHSSFTIRPFILKWRIEIITCKTKRLWVCWIVQELVRIENAIIFRQQCWVVELIIKPDIYYVIGWSLVAKLFLFESESSTHLISIFYNNSWLNTPNLCLSIKRKLVQYGEVVV